MPLSEKINKTQQKQNSQKHGWEKSGYHPGKHPHSDYIIISLNKLRQYKRIEDSLT